MLQIKNISKKYITGELVQSALDDVSLNLRKNEFVAILGPSGSGKTTLLNVIGGLDRYDSGDLIINGTSTKKYNDRDWDSYRNNSIGFVFQSYNLIPHQSILSNVELALTISGISRSERKRRAQESLKEVGLGDHMHKKPNQMSGGQMQRVAIARALINNPDILLADEPTGALDTETSAQIMKLLKEVAKDRLVVMVTHDSSLAENYATRIVKLRDGKIIADSDSFVSDEMNNQEPEYGNTRQASMSFLTSLSLSFNNLLTKKGRTILTAFAGSIGIIGIALILALSTGVNTYINDIQRDTMTSYPLTIEEQAFDLSSFMGTRSAMGRTQANLEHELDAVYSNSQELKMISQITTSLKENNLSEFKKHLDDPANDIHQYLRDNGVVYSYDVGFSIFARNSAGELIDTSDNPFSTMNPAPYSARAEGNMRSLMVDTMSSAESTSPMRSMHRTDTFAELLPGSDGKLINAVTASSYDVIHGSWPENYNEVVIVLDRNNEIPTTALYSLGILSGDEYEEVLRALNNGKEPTTKTYSWDFDEILNQTFYLVPFVDYYVENETGTFDYISADKLELEALIDRAVNLKISGIIRPTEDATNANITGAVAYTNSLTNYLIDYSNNSDVVKAQADNPNINILTGLFFQPSDDKAKANDLKKYVQNLGISDKATITRNALSISNINSDPAYLQEMQNADEIQLATMMEQFINFAGDEALLFMYDSYIYAGNYDDNLKNFGFVSLDAPTSISLYADTFEDKHAIGGLIANYNSTASEENQISYMDPVAMMTSSITAIINVISYVLIAFVAVSLVVSSIMIGIITYISVVERTKEIGILRALGASKQNISQVFNAETFIIGLFSGILGVGISILLTYPINRIIHNLTGNTMVNAALPFNSVIILILLSIFLTLIGGFIPSRGAAKKDPVIALRTE